MGIPVLTGDIGGPYMFPSTPPVFAPASMIVGSTTVFIGGRSVMLFGAANTSLGAIISGTLFTTTTFIEGKPVHLAGSLTNTSAGWLNGILQGSIATVLVN